MYVLYVLQYTGAKRTGQNIPCNKLYKCFINGNVNFEIVMFKTEKLNVEQIRKHSVYLSFLSPQK